MFGRFWKDFRLLCQIDTLDTECTSRQNTSQGLVKYDCRDVKICKVVEFQSYEFEVVYVPPSFDS